MKQNKFNLISALVLCYFAGTLKAAHITETMPLEPAVMNFEILSQNLADKQNDKSLNMPVVIRKDIDAFVEDLGRVPEDKDKASLYHQMINKHGQALVNAINNQLGERRESDAPTLRQLLQEGYGEQEKELARRFAQDLIGRYTSRAKSFTVRLQKDVKAIKEHIVNFAIHKNALLVSLFDYKKIDFSEKGVEKMSAHGSLVQGTAELTEEQEFTNNIYQRYGDEYRLQDTIPGSIFGSSRDFSVIVAGTEDGPETYIYTLDKTTNKWKLSQTLFFKEWKQFSICADGSTIGIVDGNIIHTYVRQNKLWQEQKPLIVQKIEGMPGVAIEISPHGLILQVENRPREIGFGLPQPIYTKYQRQGNSWQEINNLPDGKSSFNADDSLMLIQLRASNNAEIYMRAGGNWQRKQLFKRSPELLGNGELIIEGRDEIYVKKQGPRWQRQQYIGKHKINYPIHNIYIRSNDDGSILAQHVEDITTIYTRYGDFWQVAQTLPDFIADISSDGLVMQAESEIYVIPQIVRDAAKKLNPEQWLLINDLYGAHLKGHVILNEEQRQLFNTLPPIFQQAINSKWRVPEEEQVQAYKESKELKSEASRRAGGRPGKRQKVEQSS